MQVDRGRMLKGVDLLVNRLHDTWMAVPDRNRHDAGVEVQIAMAGFVVEILHVAFDDQERLAVEMEDCWVGISPAELEQLLLGRPCVGAGTGVGGREFRPYAALTGRDGGSLRRCASGRGHVSFLCSHPSRSEGSVVEVYGNQRMHRETLWWEAPAVLPPSFCVRTLFVYIMASSSRVLYVGVTNNIRRRVEEHRNGESDFTSRYRIRRLVYVEQLGPPIVVISREKQIKRISRDERLRLVAGTNPEWHDLAEAWFRFPFGTSPVSVRNLRVSGKQRREKQARSQGRRLK